MPITGPTFSAAAKEFPQGTEKENARNWKQDARYFFSQPTAFEQNKEAAKIRFQPKPCFSQMAEIR